VSSEATIEALATRIVQTAPVIDRGVLDELLRLLRADASELALVIARVYELVATGEVAAAIALPHLAMACATLCDPRSTTREFAAAQYEIETLLPPPTKTEVEGSGFTPDPEIDVPIASLTRGPRPRT